MAIIRLLFILGIATAALAQIAPPDARDYVGQIQTVCGDVRSTRYAFTLKGAPTLLNMGTTDDNFTVVIWKKHLKNFRHPSSDYAGERLCVTGKIKDLQGNKRIEVKTPDQIVVQRRP